MFYYFPGVFCLEVQGLVMEQCTLGSGDSVGTMQNILLNSDRKPTKLSNYLYFYLLKNRHTFTPLPFYNILQWIMLGALMSPCCVQCLTFKVGVLGPWNCDPVFPKALPVLAAKLAVGRINEDFSLDLGCKVDFVILQEACETSKALTKFVQYENSVHAFVGPLNPGFCNSAALLGKKLEQSHCFMGLC